MAEREVGGGTVGKAVFLLDRVANAGRPVRFSDLMVESPFPKATLYRLLQTLTETGMVSFDGTDMTYRPGLRLVQLAHSAWAQSSLAPIARPHLDALSALVQETVHLAQIDNGHVLYVDKRNAVRPVEMFSQAGRIGPAYCTGIGKAMLAFLPEAAQREAIRHQSFLRFTDATLTSPDALQVELAAVRAEGVAWDREEHEAGIVCVAVPVLTGSGRMVGGLSVTSQPGRLGRDGLAALIPDLRRTAAAIGHEAEAWLFPALAEEASA